ncbi:MAG: 7-carboxy-7-deazaguanine synthase QueE [Paludibacteraceae bacterium]
MYRINEIFYSLQGEGYHTGTPVVFVRFSGCNLRCPFCDTEFADYTEMSAEKIVEEIHTLIHKPSTLTPQHSTLNTTLSTLNTPHSTLNSNHSPLIVLTGGEPALQVDAPLLRALHGTGMAVCIETNGTYALPDGIDWVTCSPKQGTRLALTRADELKVVLTEDTDPEQWLQHIQADHLFLQPCSCQNTEQVIDYILRHPHWRLSLQTHKYLHIR